jgi:hypothetical protein
VEVLLEATQVGETQSRALELLSGKKSYEGFAMSESILLEPG